MSVLTKERGKMSLNGKPLISSREPNRAVIKSAHVRVGMKRYASPGGESKMYVELTTH